MVVGGAEPHGDSGDAGCSGGGLLMLSGRNQQRVGVRAGGRVVGCRASERAAGRSRKEALVTVVVVWQCGSAMRRKANDAEVAPRDNPKAAVPVLYQMRTLRIRALFVHFESNKGLYEGCRVRRPARMLVGRSAKPLLT